MKNILIIKSSNRPCSITNRMCDFIKENADCEITEFDLTKENIHFCDSCDFCKTAEKCKYNDLDEFFTDFEKADTVVFATPVRNGTFSAPMKILLERFQCYFESFYKNNKTQPIKKQREAVLIGASGRDETENFKQMKMLLARECTVLNMKLKASFICVNTDSENNLDDVKKEILKEFNV